MPEWKWCSYHPVNCLVSYSQREWEQATGWKNQLSEVAGLNFHLSLQGSRGGGFESGYTWTNVKHSLPCTHTHTHARCIPQRNIKKPHPQIHTNSTQIYPQLGTLAHNLTLTHLQSLRRCLANLWTQFPAAHSAVTPVGEERGEMSIGTFHNEKREKR